VVRASALQERAAVEGDLVSWAIAFFEYCLQVPANRWGYGEFTAAQLKVAQGAG